MENDIEIAIVGGTGVYDTNMLENVHELTVKTPYGDPSDTITVGEYKGKKIALLPRHGKSHSVPPHKINYRANIDALKQIGVKRILSICATGSLQPEYKPGELAVVDQLIDMTKGRENTFFTEGKVFHVSLADPVCPELASMSNDVMKSLDVPHHETATYICIQGPRYSTRAESLFFKETLKGHVIGMTMATECALAREAEICYIPLACVTDYDVWAEKPVSAKAVRDTMKKNIDNVKRVVFDLIERIPGERSHCECGCALSEAEQ